MGQILGHARWPTTPLAFCAGRQPARKWKKAERSNLTQRDKPSSRRLQLAAEGSGAIGLALRRWRRQVEAAEFGQPTASMTRWRVSALPSATQPVEQQRELVARGEKEIMAAASKIRTQKRERKTAQARAADTERTEAPQPSPEQQPDAALSEPITEAPPPDPYLATIEGIVATLSHALVSVDEVKDLRRKAIAVKQIRDKALAAERQFREIRSSAQLRAGELLLEMGKAGVRETGKPTRGRRVGTYTSVPKLKDLGGITRKESQDWQRLAKRQRRKLGAALAGKTVRRRPSLRRQRRRSRPAA